MCSQTKFDECLRENENSGKCVVYVCDNVTKIRCAGCLSHLCADHGNHCARCTTLADGVIGAHFCVDCMGSNFEYCDGCQSESDDEK